MTYFLSLFLMKWIGLQLFFYSNKLIFAIIIARNCDSLYVLFLLEELWYGLLINCLLHGTDCLEFFQLRFFSRYLQFKMFP